MNYKIICFLFLVCFSSLSSGQLGNPNNIPNAAANAVAAVVHSFKRDDISKDSISGNCSFNESSCNGAEIALFKKDKKVFVMTLTSNGPFKIPNLQAKETYILKLTWAKHKLSETRSVESGEYIEILLKK